MVVETDAINTPGWFNVTAKGDKNTLAVFGFNNNRNESNMQFLSENDIKNQTVALPKININTNNAQVLGAQISSELSGKQLWRWFIALALILLLTEIVLIRLIR